MEPHVRFSTNDTDGSAQAIDLNIKISRACSGFGSNVEIVTGSLPIDAIG